MGENMDEQLRSSALLESRKALDLMARPELST